MNEKIDILGSVYETKLTYPGKIRNYPYLIYQGKILEIIDHKWNDIGNGYLKGVDNNKYLKINKFISLNNLTPIKKRIGVIAFGANRSPENICWKLRHYSEVDTRDSIFVLPIYINNADAVAANIYYSGHFYADIISHHKFSEGVQIEAVLLLVDKKQFLSLNRSEEIPERQWNNEGFWGAGLSMFTCISHDNCYMINGLCYVSATSIFLSPYYNTPIAFKEIKAKNRKLPEGEQRDFYEHLFKMPELDNRFDYKKIYNDLFSDWKVNKDKRQNHFYTKLRQVILKNCLKDKEGFPINGFIQAKKNNRLLNFNDTWDPPDKFYYPQMIEMEKNNGF